MDAPSPLCATIPCSPAPQVSPSDTPTEMLSRCPCPARPWAPALADPSPCGRPARGPSPPPSVGMSARCTPGMALRAPAPRLGGAHSLVHTGSHASTCELDVKLVLRLEDLHIEGAVGGEVLHGPGSKDGLVVLGAERVWSVRGGGGGSGQGRGTHRRRAVHLVPAAEDEAGLPVVHPAEHRPELARPHHTPSRPSGAQGRGWKGWAQSRPHLSVLTTCCRGPEHRGRHPPCPH